MNYITALCEVSELSKEELEYLESFLDNIGGKIGGETGIGFLGGDFDYWWIESCNHLVSYEEMVSIIEEKIKNA